MLRFTPRTGRWAALLASGLFGVASLSAAPAGSKPVAGKQQTAEKTSRHGQELRVELAWMADPVTFRCPLHARAAANGVEVFGLVPSAETRQRALNLARAAAGGNVIDSLRVKGSPAGTKVAPAEDTHRGVLQALTEVLGKDRARTLEIGTRGDGQVTLRGKVATFQSKHAISAHLRLVPGCACVVNLLEVETSAASAATAVSREDSRIGTASPHKLPPLKSASLPTASAKKPTEKPRATAATATSGVQQVSYWEAEHKVVTGDSPEMDTDAVQPASMSPYGSSGFATARGSVGRVASPYAPAVSTAWIASPYAARPVATSKVIAVSGTQRLRPVAQPERLTMPMRVPASGGTQVTSTVMEGPEVEGTVVIGPVPDLSETEVVRPATRPSLFRDVFGWGARTERTMMPAAQSELLGMPASQSELLGMPTRKTVGGSERSEMIVEVQADEGSTVIGSMPELESVEPTQTGGRPSLFRNVFGWGARPESTMTASQPEMLSMPNRASPAAPAQAGWTVEETVAPQPEIATDEPSTSSRRPWLFRGVFGWSSNRKTDPAYLAASGKPYVTTGVVVFTDEEPVAEKPATKQHAETKLVPAAYAPLADRPEELRQKVLKACGSAAREVVVKKKVDGSMQVTVQMTDASVVEKVMACVMKVPEIQSPTVHVALEVAP